MNQYPDSSATALEGMRVLVPRGGPWGDGVAAVVRSRGATPVVAPLVNFAPASDPETLERAIADLGAGMFDWITLTSATTVDVLYSYGAVIPPSTRVVAVGETTAAALTAMGYRVDLLPTEDNSAQGMAERFLAVEHEPQRILSLRSEIAKPVLSRRLQEAGHEVRSVVAYRTIGVAANERVAGDVASGRINAILVTSGSVAEQVGLQFPEIPASTVIAAIGPRTARDARKAGLAVTVVAHEQSVESLLDAVAAVVEPSTH